MQRSSTLIRKANAACNRCKSLVCHPAIAASLPAGTPGNPGRETRGGDLFAFRCLMRHSGMHDRVRCVRCSNQANCAHFGLIPTFLAVVLRTLGVAFSEAFACPEH